MTYKRAELTIIVFSVDDIITTSDMTPGEITYILATTTSNKPKVDIVTIAT